MNLRYDFFSNTSFFPKFWGSLSLGGLKQWPNGPNGRPAMGISRKMKSYKINAAGDN